jgi:hypothetical protein
MMSQLPDFTGYAEQLADERPRFATRDDIGDTVGIMDRLLRFLQGNPSTYQQATSANNTVFSRLPDDPRAQTAIITVLGASIIYRTDGSNPSAALDQTLTAGSIITLYGIETIKGFVFAAAGAVQATLAINYYD